MTAATIAERIRLAMQPRRYSLPPEAEQYARRHKSAAGQQEFRWITIGAQDREGGGTHVQIKSSTGEIVAGPDALTGKKVGELGKPDAKKPESKSNEKPARKSGYFKGDRIEYTGKMVDGFHEFEYMEGHKKGQNGVTATAQDGTNPNDGRSQREWKQQQEEFRRLRDEPSKPDAAKPEQDQESKPDDKPKADPAPKGIRHADILDHLKTGKHTSLSELRDAIGGEGLEEDLQSLADDDRISMHKPRAGEPGLWMTPEQVKRHSETATKEPAEPAEPGHIEQPTASVPKESQPSLEDSDKGEPIPANSDEPAGEAAKARFDKAYPPLSDAEKEYAKAFKSLDEAMESSGFNTRLSTELRKLVDDGAMTHDKANKYWKSTREKFARCFERYVQRKLHKADRENTYLTGLSDGGSVWPTDAEADALEPHFDKLFAAHRKAKYGSEEPQRFSREELADFYAKQLGFNFDEAKHPRDEGGRFSKKKASESGKSYSDWSSSISDAFRNGDIDEDHPAWKALVSEAAKPGSVDDFRDYKNLKGQHVRTSNGHHGVVVDAADDLSHVIVEHDDGGKSEHFLEGLDHLGARIMHDLGRGRPSDRDMNYMAGVIAKEMQASGQPVGEAMKAHGLEGVSVTMPMRKLIAEKLADAKGGGGDAAKPRKPEPSEAHKAVASRFGIPPEAVQDIASTDVKELRRRDEYTPPNYAGDGPVTDYEDHPLGTARIMSFGDPNEAYVDFMHEFDPNDLTPTEHEDGIKQRDKSYPKYVEWAKAGHKPPPISAAVSEKTGKYLSMNRRRVLAAQDAGVKSIKGWLGVNNKETGNPLKYGDVMRALKEHEQKAAAKPEAPPVKAKPPGVAGMQQSLFGQDQQTGQKSLFNVSKPAVKKPAAKEIAAKITGRLGELLAGKDTVSPADLTIPLQSESLPGQRSMFSMTGAEQYEKRWVTLGKDGAENRTRCQIDDDGRITAGPAALKGDNIASLGDKSKSAERRVKADHAKAAGKTGRDVTTKQAVSLGLANKVQQHQHASKHAKLAGVSTADVLKLMPEAQQFLAEQSELRERAKDRARKLTGMNAGTLAQIENSHRDYSTVPGFDKAANAVAMEHPELGLDPDDSDTAAAVWDLIREGKQDPPVLHSPEVAKLAADWLKASKSGKKQAKPVDNDDSVPFSMSEADSEKVRLNRQSSVDATREPR